MQAGSNASDLLESLKCPITYELFRDPVIGSDGHTYERATITAWIQKHATSPITREPMTLNSLRPNYIVKKMVDDFVTVSLQKQYQFRLDVDICISNQRPIFKSSHKTIYEAKWMLKHGPPIVLIKIDGAKANCEASFYVKLSCHPHIVRTYGLIDSHSSDCIMLVQEYASKGDLSRLLRNHNFQPTSEVLLEIFCQIVDAMICLADNQIIHGDLACRNVLVFRSSSNQSTDILVKLTDFGLTRASPLFSIINSSTSAVMKVIPIRYAAPEILLDTSPTSYSEKSDVYSFGVLMWEAFSNGTIPYEDLKTTEDVYQKRLKGISLQQPMTCSDEFWNIIENCIQQESSKRPNFKTIQEGLLVLRFQNKRESVNRIAQIDSTYMNTTNRTLSTTNFSDRNVQRSFNQEVYTNLPIYHNLNNSSKEYEFSQSNISKQSICQYYVPCEYCLQSINDEDFNSHKDICSVRRIVKSFAKLFVRLPFLEITSCEFCDNLIPLNMLNIHRNTCTKNSPDLHNVLQNSPKTPVEDSYVTFIYLKPISLPQEPPEATDYEYAKYPDEPMPRLTSTFTIPSEISSSQSSAYRASTSEISRKPPKSGLRKAFSKLKKKMSP